MTRRVWLNLILLLFVIALALVAYIEPGKKRLEERSQLLSLPIEQVTRVQLQRHGAETIEIERTDNGWMIVAPIRIAASNYRVNTLLQLMSATSYSHFSAAVRPLSAFGLDKPLGTVVFNDQAILFGNNEPLNNRRYVLIGDQVHLTDDRNFYQSQLQLTALVDTALVPPGRSLKQIRLPGLLLQQHQGEWRSQWLSVAAEGPAQPAPTSADINSLVDEWRRASAMQVSHYQSDVAEGSIELEFADGETMALEILAREPELILGRRALNLRFHFSADQAERLLNLPQGETSGSGSAVANDLD